MLLLITPTVQALGSHAINGSWPREGKRGVITLSDPYDASTHLLGGRLLQRVQLNATHRGRRPQKRRHRQSLSD